MSRNVSGCGAIRLLPRLSALAVGLMSAFLWPAASAAEFRGLWVDSWSSGLYTAAQISQLVSDARAGHFNALVVEVRRRGDAFYNSNYEPKNAGVAEDFDPLADLIAKAHDTSAGQRLEVHCWIVAYPIWPVAEFPPPQTNHPLNLHPEWRNRTSTGAFTDGGTYYFDPGHPEVQQHTFNVAMDIISRYDVDGLNWDYIRYPGTSWGYSAIAVARFNSKFNRTGQPSTSDPDWRAFRRDQVTALVRKVYLSAIAIKPNVVLSADVFTGSPGITSAADFPTTSAYSSVMQDWLAWMQEGILDLNIPMTYFDQSTSGLAYSRWNNFIKNHRYNRQAVVGPSINSNTISNSVVQIRLTREATPEGNRGDGVCCYSYASSNNEGLPVSSFLSALTQPTGHDPISPPVFSALDVPPDRPWKSSPTRGYLKGFVYDDLANGLDGAAIALSGPGTNELASDATGFYGAVDLAPGLYTVSASFPGYAMATQTVSVTAGTVGHLDFTLTPTGVAIVLQPQDGSALVESNAVLSVSTAGVKPLSYQWMVGGVPLAGATASSLVLTNIQLTNAGAYQVVVSNTTGSVTSLVAKLTALLPIRTSVTGSGAVRLMLDAPGYAPNSTVSLAGVPAAGWVFTNWSGDISSTLNPLTILVTNSLSVTGNFVASPHDLILDNAQAVYTGGWTAGSSAPGYYGADYRYSGTTGGPATATATYRPMVSVAGTYDVYLWYPQGSNRATNAPWVVSYSGGSVTSLVNQTTGGGGWAQIARGKYFAAGTNGYVQLANNTGTSGKVVMADAVRLIRSSAQTYVPLSFGPWDWDKTGCLRLPVLGNRDQTCLVEGTTDFKQWLPVANVRVGDSPGQVMDADSHFYPYRFYRARQINVFPLADFEANPVGAAVLFRAPGTSGTTSEFVDKSSPNFTRVTNTFPAGNASSKVLQASWNFVSGSSGQSPWLRFTTHAAAVLPNPTVSFHQGIGFAVWADRDIYLAAGLRETSPTAAIGADGGTTGTLEWIGGISDNTTDPPKGRFIPAGQWVWVSFCIPAEPVRAFRDNGNGILESTTGKGVFDELVVVPADGLGRYNLYLDNFQFLAFDP
ncbi:MAG TPA: family 10 glycosylhydrolase [Candidatus Paceibacterota bacterium]|nr:family 10 glycosylhydrolase [Verrucomicrobiota bacterium]HSA11808.1 family 10 glycosylhydrolase [Candidatus Paceibacterota bacterium]